VPRLCPHCRVPRQLSEEECCGLGLEASLIERIGHRGAWDRTVNESGGCDACRGRGFVGRVLVVDQLVMTPLVREIIQKGYDPVELDRVARAEGFEIFRTSGARQLAAGEISPHSYHLLLAGGCV